MKNFKKMMALVIAMVMVLAMALPAGAAIPTDGDGTITINSPVVGATYDVYKIFNMTTNEAEDAFSYTIDTKSPFYAAVKAYADVTDNKLTLTPITTAHVDDDADTTEVDETYDKFNVSVSDGFDAQKFGKAMQDALTDSITPDDSQTATITYDNTSDFIKFTGLDLGYFLINPTYPKATAVTVNMGTQTFTAADLDEDGNLTTGDDPTTAASKIKAYVDATVTDAYVNDYIEKNGITTNTDGSPLNDEGIAAIKAALKASMTTDAENKIKAALGNNGSEADINVKEPTLVFLDSSKPDAVINEKNEIDKWDIPVNPEGEAPEGTPDHGKPEGGKNIVVSEDPQYFADWSEAEIGESVHYQLRVNAMNFIRKDLTDDNVDNETVNQVKEYFLADYQSGHMEFDESKGLKVTVWQGDNANDSQASTKDNVTKNAEGESVTELDYTTQKDTFFKNTTTQDAASKPTDIFGTGTGIMVPWVKVVENPTEEELTALKAKFPVYTITNVPKTGDDAYKTEERINNGTEAAPVYVPVKKVDENGNWISDGNGGYVNESDQYVSVNNHIVNAQGYVYDTNADGTLKTDANGNYVFVKDTTPVYIFSLYNSDVTIVVDYWMILKDDAIVDEPGNKNYAQYAWNPVDNKDESGNPKTPTNPSDTDKPSQKEEVDEATVYTFAIAWVKVDEKGNQLANAEFELPFYVKPVADKDKDTYVFLVSKKALEDAAAAVEAAEGDAKTVAQAELDRLNTLKAQGTDKITTTTESAVITIKGVEQGKYSIKETKAPEGYNLLTAPFEVEAKKSGVEATTKTKTTIYFDANGNITDTVTTATTEYTTDKDSNVDNVPVYQFDPVVNKQGTELPSTGGMGTTIFYIIGAILVLGAGILLVTRRRMNAN